MILQWKKDIVGDYTATWQGIQFFLAQTIGKKWFLYANGRRVNGEWATAKLAMETVDAKQNKIIVQNARPVAVNRAHQAA